MATTLETHITYNYHSLEWVWAETALNIYEAFERFNGLPLSVRETDDNAFFKKFVNKKLFDEFFSSP
jgi:hypothetical protein